METATSRRRQRRRQVQRATDQIRHKETEIWRATGAGGGKGRIASRHDRTGQFCVVGYSTHP